MSGKRAYVVAIAGGTCSGKSTITEKLLGLFEGKCRVKAFHMDSYFLSPPPTTIAPITRKEYVEYNHPSSLNLRQFDQDFQQAVFGGEFDLVFVEGLFALYLDEIRENSDLKVFIDLASDARLVRRVKKHMEWGQSFEQVTDRYLDTVVFRHQELIEPSRWHADVVINGTLDDNLGTEVIACYISSKTLEKGK